MWYFGVGKSGSWKVRLNHVVKTGYLSDIVVVVRYIGLKDEVKRVVVGDGRVNHCFST